MKPRTYGPFPYSPIIDRPQLEWPNGAHVALWIIPNIEYFSLMEKVRRATAAERARFRTCVMWAERDYGNRVGVFRIMETLDRYGIRGTVALNSESVRRASADHRGGREAQVGVDGPQREQHPPAQRGRARRGGADHPQHVRDHREAHRQAVRSAGSAPACRRPGTRSTISPTTAVEYVADWCNDDQPYEMTLDDGRSIVVDALHPAAQRQVGDRAAQPDGGRRFREMICDQFDVLYQEGAKSGRVMAICAASLPDRRAAPDRRARRGAEVHLQAQEGLEGDRLGNCKALPRAVEGRCQGEARKRSRRSGARPKCGDRR